MSLMLFVGQICISLMFSIIISVAMFFILARFSKEAQQNKELRETLIAYFKSIKGADHAISK